MNINYSEDSVGEKIVRNIRHEKSMVIEPYLNNNSRMVFEHCKRVANILRIISQPLLEKLLENYKLPNTAENMARMSKYMYLAGRYHDVGMKQEFEKILQQNKIFTDTEREIVQMHVKIGNGLIENTLPDSSFEKKILLDVVYNHHERYDGSGYLRGLSGEQIPLAAQLCAIADSYDSMTTYRVYKDTMTLSEANEELIKKRGVLYSPVAVDAFMTMFDRIEELYNLRKAYRNNEIVSGGIKADFFGRRESENE